MNWNDPTPTPVLADIIYANEHGKNSWDVLKWDVLKSVGRKYEKGKLVACYDQ